MTGAEVAPETADTPTDATQYGGALAGIAKRQEEIRSQSHLTLVVPGYEGSMRVRYRLLPEAEMDSLGRRIEDAQRGEGLGAALDLEADILIRMCDRILVRNPDTDTEQELADDKGPVRFEGRLADILSQAGVKFTNDRLARAVVLDLFCPREDPTDPTSLRTQPQAMELHTDAILKWHRGEKENIARRLLGE